MTSIIHLAVDNPSPLRRTCDTCLHGEITGSEVLYVTCLAFGGRPASVERVHETGLCGPEGRYWEPTPPPQVSERVPSLMTRLWRLLVGYTAKRDT